MKFPVGDTLPSALRVNVRDRDTPLVEVPFKAREGDTSLDMEEDTMGEWDRKG